MVPKDLTGAKKALQLTIGMIIQLYTNRKIFFHIKYFKKTIFEAGYNENDRINRG